MAVHMKHLAFAAALVAAACTKPGPTAPDGSATQPATATAEVPPVGAAATGAPTDLSGELNSGTSTVAGCLASPGRMAQGERSRAAMDPAEAKPELTVTPAAGGVRVVHEVAHACCLESKIETKVSGGTVTITESLFGTPCRCMCTSTISTSVRLGSGQYTLRVVVDHAGQQKTTEQKLVVK